MITVYTKPACIQCTATTREMERRGIPYSLIDITKDEQAYDKVRKLGYMQAPIVMSADESDHWSGFRPDKIGSLAQSA